MIYPTLHINSNGQNSINLIDSDFQDNPILTITDRNIEDGYFTLLMAFINQYNYGYSDAIDDGAFGPLFI